MKLHITIDTDETPIIDFAEKPKTDPEFKVGDVIQFKLHDGEEVEAMAVKQEADGMIFCFVDSLAETHRMNPTNTNEGGYEKSELRKWLNSEVLNRFTMGVRVRMKPFPNGDLLRIPTEKEIFGTNEYGEDEPETTEQWEPMKRRRNRIAFRGKEGPWEWYWLQNRVRDVRSSAGFAYVYNNGNATAFDASGSLGVRPAFKI